jgi:predicted HicB family RNase H-like nuclease
MGKPSTEAQNRYIAKAYDRVNLTLPKGRKEEVKAHADKQGESLNGFIQRAIDETMQRDNSPAGKERIL